MTTEVAWSNDLQDDILQHVLEMQPDLLLKQVEHEPALKRAFFTPLDWQLLRHCPVPVYLLGASQPALPRQIVAAVDVADTSPEGQARNDSIVQQAGALALQTGAQLDLLHACDLSMAYMGDMGYAAWAIGDIAEPLRQALEDDFRKLAERFGAPPQRCHFVLGRRSRCSAHTSNHSRWRYWSWGGPSHGDWTVCSAVPPNMCCTRYRATSWWCRNARMTTPWA